MTSANGDFSVLTQGRERLVYPQDLAASSGGQNALLNMYMPVNAPTVALSYYSNPFLSHGYALGNFSVNGGMRAPIMQQDVNQFHRQQLTVFPSFSAVPESYHRYNQVDNTVEPNITFQQLNLDNLEVDYGLSSSPSQNAQPLGTGHMSLASHMELSRRIQEQTQRNIDQLYSNQQTQRDMNQIYSNELISQRRRSSMTQADLRFENSFDESLTRLINEEEDHIPRVPENIRFPSLEVSRAPLGKKTIEAPEDDLKKPAAKLFKKPDKSIFVTSINKSEDVRCCICLDKPSDFDLASINSCNHKFCFTCIEKWADRENTCPLCKSRFNKIDRVNKPPPKKKRKKTCDGIMQQGPTRLRNSKRVKKRSQSSDLGINGNSLRSLFASMEASGNTRQSIAQFIMQGTLTGNSNNTSDYTIDPLVETPSSTNENTSRNLFNFPTMQSTDHQRLDDVLIHPDAIFSDSRSSPNIPTSNLFHQPLLVRSNTTTTPLASLLQSGAPADDDILLGYEIDNLSAPSRIQRTTPLQRLQSMESLDTAGLPYELNPFSPIGFGLDNEDGGVGENVHELFANEF